MSHALARILAITCFCGIPGFVHAEDWPRFRGPNATGHAPELALPANLAADAALWKVELPGLGHSSPIVSGGRIYLQSSDVKTLDRMLICLDAATGRPLWQRAWPGHRYESLHKKNTLASSSPAVEGDRVVALFWDGSRTELVATDRDGNLAWKQALGAFASEHGFGTSPVIHQGRVLVNYDQDRSAVLCAFDLRDGRPLWKAERKGHRACYSTPIIRATANGAEIVVTTTTSLTGYDPASGAVRWNHDWDWSFTREPLRMVASPVIYKDLVYAHGGNGGGNSHAIALHMGGPDEKPRVVWDKKKGFPYVPCLLVRGDWLFTITDKTGLAGCYEAATGKEIWSERLGGTFTSSPVLLKDKILAVNEDGIVFLYAADARFQLLGRGSLGEKVVATPAVADGRLYIRGERHLFCFEGQAKAQ